MAKPVGLGVDPKIKSKILAGEFIKFSTLLPKPQHANDQDSKFHTVEKEGQLMFVKANDTTKIRSISKWLEAFHVFVSIYCSKHTSEVGNLMTYAQIVQGIAKSCGDDAALEYDEKFLQWHEASSKSCPWNQKNPELFQDAMVLGLENKSKIKKQPFRATQTRYRHCFTYNNKGSCPKGNNCPYLHICQNCTGKHPRTTCIKIKTGQHNSKQFTNDTLRKSQPPPKKD
ncbi:uncharacterized protein LOC134278947 [Saccostrea cucullata]|uniref:uncharacterized protein LOC134278947 n=1 Tax=Saccostrea cuccullata TaxID=36930 RepID=UPI002ED20DE6